MALEQMHGMVINLTGDGECFASYVGEASYDSTFKRIHSEYLS